MVTDKIFISTLNAGDNHYSITPTDNPANKKYEVEYVRKDTLLKWAKNMKHICKGSGPVEKVFQIIIDKLNSM